MGSESNAEAPSPQKHCILIANGKFPEYRELGDLVTPMGDIEAIVRVLEAEQRDTFTTTVLKDAKAVEIFSTLRNTLRTADRRDLVIIYYSGHGMLNKDMELFLAATDTDGNADECNPARRVRFKDLNDEVERNHLSRVLFILDCCHSAAAAKNFEPKAELAADLTNGIRQQTMLLDFTDCGATLIRRSDAYRDQETKGALEEGAGVYLLAACGTTQRANGDLNEGMGVFTKYLCEGLQSGAIVVSRGNEKMGFVPISRLFSYVYQKMAGNPYQKPVMFSRNVSGDDLIITNIYDFDRYRRPLTGSTKFWDPVPTLENVSPSYLLESDYTFLDWNASFEAVVAAPLRLVRGMHVQTFLERLDNWEPEVKTHSIKKFPDGVAPPRIDTEKLELRTKRFGLIVFHKIASRLRDGSGRWCVNLNVSYVQAADKFWNYLSGVMERDEIWSTYAESYDPIISSFRDNRDLVQTVIDQLPDNDKQCMDYCLDVGAGTGSTSLQLLRKYPACKIVAIDINKRMMEKFNKKLADGPPEDRDRVELRLGDCLAVLSRVTKLRDGTGTEVEQRDFADDTFDACVMMNVLFALDNPVECLEEIYRVLKPGGILSLSTSHGATNIENLFERIKTRLIEDDEWEEKKELFENALARNREMDPIITRYTKDDIATFLDAAGFEVSPGTLDRYVNCVTVYKAVKRKTVAVRVQEQEEVESKPPPKRQKKSGPKPQPT